MKMNVGDTQVIVGKRVTLGAMVNSVAVVMAAFYPLYAVHIMGSAVAVTFALQVIVGHFASNTTK